MDSIPEAQMNVSGVSWGFLHRRCLALCLELRWGMGQEVRAFCVAGTQDRQMKLNWVQAGYRLN